MPTKDEIKAAREAANLTQAEAAQIVHQSPRAWQSWELGQRNMPLGSWELFRNFLYPVAPSAFSLNQLEFLNQLIGTPEARQLAGNDAKHLINDTIKQLEAMARSFTVTELDGKGTAATLTEIGFPSRMVYNFEIEKVKTVADLLAIGPTGVLKIPNFGRKALETCHAILNAHGFTLE